GFGTFVYDADDGRVRERLVPGEIAWASTEHNVDAYFFLRTFARVAETPSYAEAAARIARGLSRGWNEKTGQMNRGVSAEGWDAAFALDCASWSAMMLVASGDRVRAETAMWVADGRYAARDPKSGAAGHRPYVHRALLEDALLMRTLGDRLAAKDWDQLDA